MVQSAYHRELVRRGEKVKRVKPKFQFGKYKGKTVAWVVRNDPEYIVWCWQNVAKTYHPVGLTREVYEQCLGIKRALDDYDDLDYDDPDVVSGEQWAREIADD